MSLAAPPGDRSSRSARCGPRGFARVHDEVGTSTRRQNLSRLRDFGGRTMTDHEELARLQRRLQLQHAVLGNPDTIKTGADRAESTDYHRAFESRYDPGDDRAGHEHGAHAGDEEERRAYEQAPDSAPKCTELAPVFHSVASIIIADDLFFGVIVFANNRKLLHIEAGLL